MDDLTAQLSLTDCTPGDRGLAAFLIGCLDERGYLDVSLPDLSRTLSVSVSALESALMILQSLDPPGVGARTVGECFLLQGGRMRPAAAVETVGGAACYGRRTRGARMAPRGPQRGNSRRRRQIRAAAS